MSTDPEKVFEYAISPATAARLPAAITAHLEHVKSGYATITVFAAYQGLHSEASYQHRVDFTDGSSFTAHVFGRHFARPIREPVPMWGLVIGESIVISEHPVRVLGEDEVASHGLPVANPDMVDPETSTLALSTVAADHGGSVVHFASPASRTAFASRHLAEARRMSLRVTTFTTKKLLNAIVLIVQFSGESSPPTTPASFSAYFDHVRRYWKDNSYGCSEFRVLFTPVLLLAKTKAQYGTSTCPIGGAGAQLDRDAWAAANTQGYTESDYDRYVIVFSKFDACVWLGLATIGDVRVWINGAVDPETDWHVLGHELGHTYGLRHANAWVTSNQGLPVNGNAGSSVQNQDDYDMMGGGYVVADMTNFHTNNNKKFDLGWISSTELYSVVTGDCASQACNFRLWAQDRIDSASSRALRVQVTATRYYWLEVRQKIDQPAAAFYWDNGIVFHAIDTDPTYNDESDLLDLNFPFAVNDPWSDRLLNAPLQLGEQLRDTTYQFTVLPTFRGVSARGAEYMDVSVFRGASAGTISAAGGATGSCTTAGVGNNVLFSVGATHSLGRPMSFHWRFGDGLFSTTNSPVVTHSFASTGSYAVSVIVSDPYGVTTTVTGPTVTADMSSACGCTATCAHGTCSGSVCLCSYNFTGPTCGTELKVASMNPSHSAGLYANAAQVTIVATQGVFTASGALCAFRPYGIVAATFVSATTIKCTPPDINYAPYNAANSLWPTEVEVSPNNGRDWSQSRVIYTYGGGNCPSCSSGTCDMAAGVCVCDPGYTGTTCSTFISVTSVTPAFAGAGGETPLVLAGSSQLLTTTCPGPLVRFRGTNYEAYATATVSGGVLTVIAPPAPSDLAIAIDVSPNRGVDWTDSGNNFAFLAATQMYNGLALTSQTANAGQARFFKFYHNDENLPLTIEVTARSGAAPQFYVGKGQSPIITSGMCTMSLWQDCFGPSTSSQTYMMGKVYVGTLVIAVAGQAGGASTFDIVIRTPTPALAQLVPDARAPINGFVPDATRTDVYALQHTANGVATRIAVTAGSSAAWMQASTLTMGVKLNGGPGLTPATATVSGTTIVLQSCDTTGSYAVAVKGPGVYLLSAEAVWPPTTPQGFTLAATQNSITVTWPNAVPAPGTAVAGFKYAVYYKAGSKASDLDSSCKAEGTTQAAADIAAAAQNTKTISSLSPGTTYTVNVVVTDSRGAKAVFTPQTVTTQASVFLCHISCQPNQCINANSCTACLDPNAVPTPGPDQGLCACKEGYFSIAGLCARQVTPISLGQVTDGVNSAIDQARNLGLPIGVAIGGAVALLIIIVLVCMCCRRRNRKPRDYDRSRRRKSRSKRMGLAPSAAAAAPSGGSTRGRRSSSNDELRSLTQSGTCSQSATWTGTTGATTSYGPTYGDDYYYYSDV